MSYQHILLATDLTAESDRIMDKGMELAQVYNAKCSLIHILNLMPTLFMGAEFLISEQEDANDNIKKIYQDSLIKQGKRLNIPEENQYLLLGPTALELVEFIQKQKIDLLVLGYKPDSKLSIFFGSTTDALFHAMPCDIWVVTV